MGKRNKTNKAIKVNVSAEQKQMLAAAQAAPVEKTKETAAENDNEVAATVQTDSGPVEITGDASAAQATLPTPAKDKRTSAQRRNDRLALREKALQEALAKDLPFFEGYPAAKFEENYDEAFKAATTAEKAIPAKTIIAKREEVAASIAAAKKTPAQELVEAAKASQMPSNDNLPEAEMDNTETSKDAADLALMQKAEELDKSPVAVVAEGQEVLVSHDGEIVGEKVIGETTTETYDGIEYVIGADGQLVRNDGESSKKYGQRSHKLKCARYAAKRNAEKAEKEAAKVDAELVGRNDPPAKTPSEINKNLPLDIDDEGNAVDAVVTPPEKDAKESANAIEQATMDGETKVDETLVKHGSFAAAAKADNQSAVLSYDPNSTDPNRQKGEPKEEWKLRKNRIMAARAKEKQNELANNAKPVETVEPATDAPVDQSGEQVQPQTPTDISASEAPATTEPVEAVTPEPVVEEVKSTVEPAPKPKMTPKLVVDNEKAAIEDKKLAEKHTDEDRAAAKKFYGAAFTEERQIKLTQALIWLNRAITADKKLRSGIEKEGPVNLRTKFRMAMNAALKFEAEALGGTPQQITVEEVTAIFGPEKTEAKAAA